MSDVRRRYRLYDLLLESAGALSLSNWRGEGEEEPWRFEEGPVEEPRGFCVHDVLDFDGRRRLKVWVDEERGIIFSHGETRVEWRLEERVVHFEVGADLDIRRGIVLERMVAPIAFLLQRSGFVALHASAVGDGEGGAWIFVGDSGAGKSTTALNMMRRGMELLADDLVMIDGAREEIIAATPSLRLFDRPEEIPEAVDEEMVMPEIEKFWYQLPDREVERNRHKIGAIFSLEPDPSAGEPRVEALRGRRASTRILAQAFDLTEGPQTWRAQRFRTLCELARTVPLFSIRYARGAGAVPAQVQAVAAHLREEGVI